MKRRFTRDRRGAVAVEFALLAPMLIYLLWGVVSYGGYFLTAHSVQQIANDAARASIAGLDFDERKRLAEDCVKREAAANGAFINRPLAVAVAADSEWMHVSVTFDGAKHPFWAFSMLGPMPSSTVSRTGAILLGGF